MKRFGAFLLFAAFVPVACADSEDEPAHTSLDGRDLTGNDGGGGDAQASIDAPEKSLLQCVDTECPFPYTTCETDKPTYKCEINLMNDPHNCGACGVSCDSYEPIGMIGSCVQGKCDFQCVIAVESPIHNLKNCNGILDDGCEIDVYTDRMNCGVCGNKCKDGENCVEGRCGCPLGWTDCGGTCVNLETNDRNCGACGYACPYLPENGPFAHCEMTDKHAQAKCVHSTCGNLTCAMGWGDCDNDMSECPNDPNGEWTGCETPLTTMENCGACGNTCAPDQVCARVGIEIKCVDTCERRGLTDCKNLGEWGGGCRDLNNDKYYCGSCINECPRAGANQDVICNKGSCEYPCDPGFADCNGDLADGCEVNILINPSNCGACGVTCDSALGQPCVEGKCLMKDCNEDGGVVPR